MDIKMDRQSAAKHDLVFKPFPIDLGGYEQNYKVTNDGRVFSEYMQDFLKPYCTKGGYVRYKINYGDRNKKFQAHRLVALAFIPNNDPEHKTQVDHINNDRTNNCVENLRWMTPKENTWHAIDSGNRDRFKYTLIHSKTKEKLEFSNAHKISKYFGKAYQIGTINKYANTNKPVPSGFYTDWLIYKEPVVKVQRPSLAREQGQASRNGNNPTSKLLERVLIWSDLYRNVELEGLADRNPSDLELAILGEQHGSYNVWSVRADQPS